MLCILSPSKTLNERIIYTGNISTPTFAQETQTLITLLKQHKSDDLRRLMDISEAIAQLNTSRYQHWETAQSFSALHLFKGDVYNAMDAEHYDTATLTFAQSHLRILSGLYGLLRPLDAIKPYRLEMGIKLANSQGKDLYHFWGDSITHAINNALEESGSNILINLASQEYFKTVRPKALNGTIIQCDFRVKKQGKIRTIGLFAKRARGAMAHHILTNKITNPQDILTFKADNYYYSPEHSANQPHAYVFIKDID